MAQKLRRVYACLSKLPFGAYLFSCFVGFLVPYSGAPRPLVESVSPGFARLSMKQRRRTRNHLGSIHAMAMANIAELTSGLAIHFALPDNARAILVDFSIQFLKKGRRKLIMECSYDIDKHPLFGHHTCKVEIRNEAHDLVAEARVGWLIGPQK